MKKQEQPKVPPHVEATALIGELVRRASWLQYRDGMVRTRLVADMRSTCRSIQLEFGYVEAGRMVRTAAMAMEAGSYCTTRFATEQFDLAAIDLLRYGIGLAERERD
jgi:hypothetical protein